MAQSASRPWRIAVPLAALILLFAAWSAYWWIADGFAQKTVATQRDKLAAQGLTLACGHEAWGGYPFRFEFDCTSPRLDLKGRGTFTASHVLAVAQAYNPTHLILLVDGPTTAAPPDAAPVTATHDRAIISLRMIGLHDAELSADIPNVSVAGLASAGDVQLFSRPGLKPGTLDVAVRLKDAKAAPPGRPPLALDSAQAVATIDQPLHATISDISATHGEVRVWTSGEAGLDAEHRPEGTLKIATNDLKGLVAILDTQLTLTDKQRQALTMMLAFLGKEAKTTVVAANGQLSVGPLKLGALPPLF